MTPSERKELHKTCDCAPLKTYIDNPEKGISATLCRKIEKSLGKTKGWFDEQHVEADGLSHLYPPQLQEIMQRYSDMNEAERKKVLDIVRILDSQ